MKINAIITETECKHGKKVINYDREMEFKEISSVICRCEECSKAKIVYSPLSGRFFFMDIPKEYYTFRKSVRTGKIEKAHYENEYEPTLPYLTDIENRF